MCKKMVSFFFLKRNMKNLNIQAKIYSATLIFV